MFVKDMSRLFLGAVTDLSEPEKLRYVIDDINEQLFAGLAGNLPRTGQGCMELETCIERAQ